MKFEQYGRATARRIAIGAVAAIGSVALLAGCTTPAPSGAGGEGDATIEFWGFVPGLETLVDEWNAMDNGTTVEFYRMTGDDDSAKVGPNVDAGEGPDIVQLSPLDLPDYVIRDRVIDITDYVADDEELFTASSWAQFVLNDRVYGIPQDIGPRAMMYRTDLFEANGLTVPTTWDEYIEAGRQLKAAGSTTVIGNIDATGGAGAFKADVIQAGGSWYGTDGDAWTVDLNGAEGQLVAERYQTLVDEQLVSLDTNYSPEFWANVSAGKYATLLAPAWYPKIVESNSPDTTGKWALAPLPSIDGSSEAVGDDGGSGDIVLKGSEYPEQAAEFLVWLNSSKEAADGLIGEGGLYPASLNGLGASVLNQPSAFFADQPINEVYSAAAENVPPVWVNGPGWGADSLALFDEFAKSFNGQQTFVESLDIVQESAIKNLEDRGLTVKER